VGLLGLVTSLFEVGVVRVVEQQTAQVEGGREPLLLCLGEGGLLAVVAFPIGRVGERPGRAGRLE
jgi:hypothetical protein